MASIEMKPKDFLSRASAFIFSELVLMKGT
jgi:hypothetical protein